MGRTRWPIAAGLAAVALCAGCGRSVAPFFVVHNTQAVAVYVTYCPTQACAHPDRSLIRAGRSWRVTNTTGGHRAGVLFVTINGQRRGCLMIPPAAVMVDRLYTYATSTLLPGSCAGYNPARPLGARPVSSPGSAS